jgi:hypothetical protein
MDLVLQQAHVGILEYETGLQVTRHFTATFGADIYWSHMDTTENFYKNNQAKYHKTMSDIYNDAA